MKRLGFVCLFILGYTLTTAAQTEIKLPEFKNPVIVMKVVSSSMPTVESYTVISDGDSPLYKQVLKTEEMYIKKEEEENNTTLLARIMNKIYEQGYRLITTVQLREAIVQYVFEKKG